MEKYGEKLVVEEGQFKEGLIVEVREGNENEVVCREYYMENGEPQQDNSMYPINIINAMIKPTPNMQVKELEEQIGTKEFYISRKVVNLLQCFIWFHKKFTKKLALVIDKC